MTANADAFISEIRNCSEFSNAAAGDPIWLEHLAAIENGIASVDRLANEDPQMVETYDRIQDVIGSRNMTLKQRLIEIVTIFVRLRDAGRIIH